MTDAVQWLERARHEDLVADIVARVRRQTPGITDDQVAQIEAEIRRDWGGAVVRVRRNSAIERERIKDLIARGVPERTARLKVRGR